MVDRDVFSAVLFDLDGVLLDSMEHHVRLWQEVLAGEGVRVSRWFILENEGALDAGVLEGLAAEQGVRLRTPMSELLARQARLYLERCADLVRPYPWAEELLVGLREQGRRLALVTSSRRALVERCLPARLRECFTVVVSAEDVGRHKPHPEPYLTAARALGLEAERCVVVENAPAGIEAALAAGARCYAVASTLPPERLRRAQAVFPDLVALGRRLGVEG